MGNGKNVGKVWEKLGNLPDFYDILILKQQHFNESNKHLNECINKSNIA